MATWKKVIVSGSNISQLNNDSGYVTSTTAPKFNAFATASLGSTYLLADSPSGSLNFASSSGQGLTISATVGNDTLTFGLSAIPTSSLAYSTISGKTLGTNLDSLTAGSGLSGTAYNGSAPQTWTVNSGSMASYFNSASWAGVSGDILINASGVASIQANSVVLGTDTTGSYVATIASASNGGIAVNGSGGETAAVTLAVDLGNVLGANVDVGADMYVLIDANNGNATRQATLSALATAQAGTGLTATNGVFSVNYGSGSGTAVQGSTTATINVTANELVLDSGTNAQALGGGPSWTLGLADTISGSRTFSNNVTVNGDLTVLGTTTTLNTDNLLVEDKFILMASGSNSATDGGIIIQSAAGGTGYAFGYDTPLNRWVYQDALAQTATVFETPTAYATTTQYGLASAKPADGTGPSYGGTSGYGNIWVSTNTNEIWIYA